jgi:hypothetical protein
MGDEFKYGVFALYAIIIIGFVVFVIYEIKSREEKLKKLELDLKEKIENDFELSTQDIVILGRAYDLSPSNSRLALYRVYKNIKNKDSFNFLKKLVSEIQKEEPFDTMPDEVKPSLSRILELTSKSQSETDKHILTPITNILTKYQELLEERKKTRKRNNIAYTISIVSFFIGVIGLYYAFSSPSANDIANELKKLNQAESHNKPIKQD